MSSSTPAAIEDIVQMFSADRNRLLDIMLSVQQRFGQVDDVAVAAIAKGLGIHVVEVEDTVTFYAFQSRTPQAAFRIRLSKTPISIMKGALQVAHAFETALGLTLGQTSADGLFMLDWTSDIGMADQEPAALINTLILTELKPADVPEIVAQLRASGHDTSPAPYPLLLKTDPLQLVLKNARVRSSLIESGPLLSGPKVPGKALEAALAGTPEQVIDAMTAARLRGRGGAGFPTGMKWRAARKAPGTDHYVVCNADEGEPGTFKDRMLLTEFPHLVFDGMTIAAYAVGARHGIVYLRGEYTYLWNSLQEILKTRRALGLLGSRILGRDGLDFDIRIQLGAGAYVCGEESSLLNSLEGKRGAPRDRPPFPTERGYLGQPTVIDNVESFACAARIAEEGAPWFAAQGTSQSSGTKLMCVSGDCPRPGVYEVPFGITVNELLDRSGATNVQAVQVSGPSGHCIGPKDFGRRIAYEDLSTGGSTMIFGPERDLLEIALQFAEFFVRESCGWCVPCRVGTTELMRGMAKVVAGRSSRSDLLAIEALSGTVMRMSRCGLGQMAPNPILSTMRNFPELYEARLAAAPFVPLVPLHDALRAAVAVQGREPIPEEKSA
jgi:[NiFe] hydrogenase diaphorase moiety large subunit